MSRYINIDLTQRFERDVRLATNRLERDLQRDFIQELKDEYQRTILNLQLFDSITKHITSGYDINWELPLMLQKNTFFEPRGKLSIVLKEYGTGNYEAYHLYGYNVYCFSVYKVVNEVKVGKKRFETLEDLLLQDFQTIEWEEW